MVHTSACDTDRRYKPVNGLPESVQELYPREREIATAVYRRGKATAKQVEAIISTSITNGAVRCMLNRLVRKGILARRRTGKHREFVYIASVTNVQVIEHALRQFAHDFFDGSLHLSAMAFVDLLRTERNVGSTDDTKVFVAKKQELVPPQKLRAA